MRSDFMDLLTTCGFLVIFGVGVGGNSLLNTQCRLRCLNDHLNEEPSTLSTELPLERCLENAACASCELPCGYPLTSFAACSSLCQMGKTIDDVELCQRSCRFLEKVHITKSGTCPAPEEAVGIYGRCVTGCEVDGDCTGHLKCCRHSCGVTCQPPKTDATVLPPIPGTPVITEHKQQRSIDLQWSAGADNYSEPVLYVVEGRWNTGRTFSYTYATDWSQITLVSQPFASVQDLDSTKWYVFRVAAVSVNGSLGFSPPTKPYRIEQIARPPSPPRNLTKDSTSLQDGRVDVTIRWLEPAKFDLPIGKYKIMWDKRASGTSPSLNYIDQHKKMVQGEVNMYTLKNLDPDSTYYVQIQAICYNGADRLKSESVSTYIVTPAIKMQKISPAPVNRGRGNRPAPGPPRNVSIGQPYFQNGLLKATVYWKPPRGSNGGVDRIALKWSPDACIAEDGVDITHSRIMHGWATAQDRKYDIYDLLFDCRYNLRMEPVSKLGDKGRALVMQFDTPSCIDTTVVGELEPDCPTDAPNVPHKPPHVQETIFIRGRNITAVIAWKEPYSDRPIYGYRVVWGKKVKEPEGFPAYSLRDQQPIDKNTALTKVLPGDRFSLTLPHLQQLTSYVVNVQALSHIGSGSISQAVFKTPQLPPGDAIYRHYELSESMRGENSSGLALPSLLLLCGLLLHYYVT